MSLSEVFILAIIEGITEFLPISSTGHMIIAEAFLHPSDPEFTKLFTVNIQFGAILSVMVLYFRRFIQSSDFYLKLLIAFIPSAIVGFLLGDFIDSLLDNVVLVACSLLAGGIILLFVDKWFSDPKENKALSSSGAFKIGLFQCLALIPGVSRSAATIIGGLTQKLSRKASAEFSFFLAVPTMFAASAYKLLKSYKSIQPDDISNLLIGNAVAFVVAILAIRGFISFLTKKGFRLFGYYRIALGVTVLVLYFLGFNLKIN
jgi:undecaprenyl-diphosphatase